MDKKTEMDQIYKALVPGKLEKLLAGVEPIEYADPTAAAVACAELLIEKTYLSGLGLMVHHGRLYLVLPAEKPEVFTDRTAPPKERVFRVETHDADTFLLAFTRGCGLSGDTKQISVIIEYIEALAPGLSITHHFFKSRCARKAMQSRGSWTPEFNAEFE